MRQRVLASFALLPFVIAFTGCSVDESVPNDMNMPGVGDEVVGLFTPGDDASVALAAKMSLEKVQAERPEILAGIGEIKSRRVRIDQRGWAINRFAQRINDVPVFGGELIVHLDRQGEIATVYDYLKHVEIDTKPALAELDARKAAYATVEGVVSREIGTDLQILPLENGETRLTYRVQLDMTNIDGEPSMPVIFVDAHTGDVVWSYDNLQTNRNRTTYTANNKTSLPGTQVLTESGGSTSDSVLQQAHDFAGVTYDFYFSKFGRDSYNGAGAALKSTVHYSTNYVNAYWNNVQMVYGDGDGVNASPLTVLDVVAHELTHAVTSSESNLTYSNESGALNEAMSDIFGAAVEAYKDNAVSADTWKIGEDCWTPGTAGDALRYMNNPALSGSDKDYYPERYTGTDDNGGVHSNSGIANLAFYLAVAGGTHPRGKTSNNVPALSSNAMTSMDMAARIFYDANANRLSASSTFADARQKTIDAANALYGSAAANSIDQAWAAVGVGGSAPPPPPAGCPSGYTALTGTLSGTGASATYKYTTVTTSHDWILSGPSGTDFDLYLYRNSTLRAKSESATSSEEIHYNGSANKVVVKSYSGAGGFTLCYNL